jgi:hypothetical protein
MRPLCVGIVALCCLLFPAVASAQTQVSEPLDFSRFFSLTNPPVNGLGITQDLMFITKYTDLTGHDYSILTFGDTFAAGAFYGNTSGWSDDFDLSDGFTFHYRVAPSGLPGMGMSPEGGGAAPPGQENQIWFSRSFVLGQDIYTYYGSYHRTPGQGHKLLGVGLAVIRGGIPDINNMPEFTRVAKATCVAGSNAGAACSNVSECPGSTCKGFWHPAVLFLGVPIAWFDGHPVVKTDPSDGNTYLYLFNAFGLQRVLFTTDTVEDMFAYQTWDGSTWAYNNFGIALWTGDTPIRATCEYNDYLQKWISVYTIPWAEGGCLAGPNVEAPCTRNSECPGSSCHGFHDSQLAYRTADNIEGPWSDRTIIYSGPSVSDNSGSLGNPGETYSPVHRAFFNRNGGQTIYTFSSQSSESPIAVLETNFDKTVTTASVGPVARMAPQGVPETLNTSINGGSVFLFRDTPRYSSTGTLLRTYPNSYQSISSDVTASDGLTFDTRVKYKPLGTLSGEGSAWITASFQPFSGANYLGAFYKSVDRNGVDLGTGFAYARGPAKFHSGTFSHFKRSGARLTPGSLLASVDEVTINPFRYTLLLNDENDPTGSVYLARNDVGTLSIRDISTGLTSSGNALYSSVSHPTYAPDARDWVSSPGSATPLFDNALHPAIFQNAHTGGWVALYTMRTSPAGNFTQVAMRTAPRINGPWTDAGVVYSLPSAGAGKLYDVKHLDGFDEEGGKVIYFYASDRDANSVNLYKLRLDD